MVNEESKVKNYELLKTKLEPYGISGEKLEEVFGDKLINATYSMDASINRYAYEGSLLNVVLRVLTPYAIKLSEILPDSIRPSRESIVKVCLLQHLAKSEMFVKSTNEWEINKGRLFTFANKRIALRLGMRSVALAIKLGVALSDIELEAMTIIDKDANDEQAKLFANPLSIIVKQANEWVNLENTFKTA